MNDEETIVVIDELGKMELLPDAFRTSVKSLFDTAIDSAPWLRAIRGYWVRTVTPSAASIESIGEKNDVSVSVHPAVLLAMCCP